MEKTKKFIVSHAPHISGEERVQTVMLDVIIALFPSVIAGVIFFGYRAALLTAVCMAACIFFEWGWCKLLKKPSTIGDLSAAVTGIILAMNLPATLPFYQAILGSLFAIIIVKAFFGGLGHNFMNPAAAARAFLLTSFAMPMTRWVEPFEKLHLINNADAITSASPLSLYKAGEELTSFWNLFIGNRGGCIGETSAIAIIIGFAYLIWRKVIDYKCPLAYVLTTFVLSACLGGTLYSGVYHVFAGGLLFSAVFMVTDYTTTPYTPWGKVIFGIGCGLITVLIRFFGGYPEGVTYGILLMNVASPLIERYTHPRRFGKVKEAKENA